MTEYEKEWVSKLGIEKFYKRWNRCLITMPNIILGENIRHQSFMFQIKSLDFRVEFLKKIVLQLSKAVIYDWGTGEVRLSDIDRNEIVIEAEQR